jgi:PKD repeat protein
MSLYFVLFIVSLPAVIFILAAIFLVDFSKNIFFDGLLFLVLLVLISPIVYVNMKTRGKDPITKNEIIKKFLDKTRSINIIGGMLVWPVVLIYFYVKSIKYVAFNGIENLTFPVYIIAASFIGVISYLFLSIEDTFCDLVPEYKKRSIAWSYLRRILIAPFIAIIGFYLINYLPNKPEELKNINDHFVFVFSFFAGVFTKSIEEWIYAWVQKLLPGDKLKEFESRDQYDVDESDLVKKLRLDEDLVYILYNERIRTIEDLASCDPEELSKRINAHILDSDEENQRKDLKYSKRQIQACIEKAQKYMGIDESELVTILKMDKDFAFKLYNWANIRTIKELNTSNEQLIRNILIDWNEKVDDETTKEIENYIEAAKEYVDIDGSELVTILDMDKGLAFKISHFANIKTIRDLSNKEWKDVYKKLDDYNVKVDENKIKRCIEAAKNTLSANFNARAPPVADFDADTKIGVEPLKVQFTDKSTGATSWQWDFGDQTGASTEQNPAHEFSKAGSYDVFLKVSNGEGHSTPKSMQITVTQASPVIQTPPVTQAPPVTPAQLIADFDVNKTSDSELLKFQFTDKSTGAASWQWNFGDHTEISKEQNPSHEFLKAGDYDVVLTVNDNKSKIDEKRKTITVTSP